MKHYLTVKTHTKKSYCLELRIQEFKAVDQDPWRLDQATPLISQEKEVMFWIPPPSAL